VPYKALLTYAKNIAPFTIPPTYRPKPAPIASDSEPKPQEGHGNGSGDEPPPAPTLEEENVARLKTLTPEQAGWIAALSNLPFQPWPGEGEMANAQGALHILNTLVVNGNDPTDVAKVIEAEREEAEDEARRKAEDDARTRVGERVVRRVQEAEDGRERARFGFDDDEDDED
jgi:hypothetical protein